MKIKGWKKLFPQHILTRGKEYYLEGAVDDIDIDEDYITGTVFGSENYYVEINLDGNSVYGMDCSCPYAEKGNYCKHMAALLFELDESEKSKKPQKTTPIPELVDKLSEKQIKTLLKSLAESNDYIADKIRIAAEGGSSENLSKMNQSLWILMIQAVS